MASSIDYRRKWHVMAAVGVGILLATIDGSIVNIALPSLVRALDTRFELVQWVVLSYLLTLTTLLLSVGRLADMVGRKTLYTVGFVVFTIGSVLCGLAPTIGWLIAMRVLQALGASMLAALGVAILTEAFPPSERGKALGIGGALVSTGIVIGPVLGGYLVDALSWRWIFFVNLPVGIVGTLMVIRHVPAPRPAGGQRFDLAGAVLLFGSLVALLLGLTLGQQQGFAARPVLALFVVSAVCLILFLLQERRAGEPMIDLRLFLHVDFSINLVTGFITFVTIAGAIILMPFYLENVLGYSPRQVGLLLAVVPVAMGAVAPVSGSLSDRLGSRPITVTGLVVLLVGYWAVSTLDQGTTVWGYLLRFLPIGLGMGIFQSPNNSVIMGSVPPTRLGIAGGLLSMTRTLGQTTGVAVLGAVWAARVAYHAGNAPAGGATDARAAAQIAGLHDTFLVVVVLMALALALGLFGLARQRRARPAPGWAAAAPE